MFCLNVKTQTSTLEIHPSMFKSILLLQVPFSVMFCHFLNYLVCATDSVWLFTFVLLYCFMFVFHTTMCGLQSESKNNLGCQVGGNCSCSCRIYG